MQCDAVAADQPGGHPARHGAAAPAGPARRPPGPRRARLLRRPDPAARPRAAGVPPRQVRERTVVWDVHEDTAAALTAKGWLPGPARPVLRPAVHRLERRSERRHRLLLAEEGYRSRFREDHPVVPNTTYVSDLPPGPPDGRRAVYVGQLSRPRRPRHDRDGPHAGRRGRAGRADRRGRRRRPGGAAGGAARGDRALVRVRPERPGAAHRRGRDGRAGAAARRAQLPALDADEGRGVHGPRRAGGQHAEPAGRGHRRARRMRADRPVRRPGGRRQGRAAAAGRPRPPRRPRQAGLRGRPAAVPLARARRALRRPAGGLGGPLLERRAGPGAEARPVPEF